MLLVFFFVWYAIGKKKDVSPCLLRENGVCVLVFCVSCSIYAGKLSLGRHAWHDPMHQCHPNPCLLSPQTKSWDFSKPGHHFWWPTCSPLISLSLSLPLFIFLLAVLVASLSEKIIPFWKDPCSSLSLSRSLSHTVALGSLHAYLIPSLDACFSCLNN